MPLDRAELGHARAGNSEVVIRQERTVTPGERVAIGLEVRVSGDALCRARAHERPGNAIAAVAVRAHRVAHLPPFISHDGYAHLLRDLYDARSDRSKHA